MIENLSDGEDLGIALPAQWLWDILDEFVYHYQPLVKTCCRPSPLRTYSTYCHKTAKMQKDKEVKELRDNPGIFETTKAELQNNDKTKIGHRFCFAIFGLYLEDFRSKAVRFGEVLNYLHQLVRFSLIEEWLADPDGGNGQGQDACSLRGHFNSSPFHSEHFSCGVPVEV